MRGIDPVTDLIPVAPAQHYASGGVITDLDGRSTIPGLYACGEVACSGVHGANRLASNSLLEGLVFARRIAEAVVVDGRTAGKGTLGPASGSGPSPSASLVITNSVRRTLQQTMDTDSGVLRSRDSLANAIEAIGSTMDDPSLRGRPCTEDWETTNLYWVAKTLALHAALREETRGSHWREDFPNPDPAWRVRLVTTLDHDGHLRTERHTPEWVPGEGDS